MKFKKAQTVLVVFEEEMEKAAWMERIIVKVKPP
jgi:hypothetical protein